MEAPRVSLGRSLLRVAADALESLLSRPGHTLAMLSGVTLAAASIAAALVLADTQQAQVDLRFDLQRSNRVVIVAETPGRDGFDSRQVAAAGRLAPIAAVGEFSIWSEGAPAYRSFATGDGVSATVMVADAGGIAATERRLVSGASTALLDARGSARIAWVGQALATELGVGPLGASGAGGPDAQILLNGVPFSVAGVVDNDEGFGYVANSVVMSRDAAIDGFGAGGANVRLVAAVRPGSAAAVGRYLLTSIDPGQNLSLKDVTPPDGEILVGGVGSDLRAIGLALGLFIGFVGVISIANTLILSVYQRFREIGLRTALGWGRGRVGMLIIVEAALAGTVAGLVGTALGFAVSTAWCAFEGWAVVVSPLVPAISVGGSLLASLGGGVGPAFRAASVSPLEAMRA